MNSFSNEDILQINHLTHSFGGLMAVNDLSFNVSKKEIFGIIGPNGAGKTTLFNLISGVYKPRMGQIIFNGEDIKGLKPFAIAQKGLLRSFQTTELFHEFSVLENVMVAYNMKSHSGFWPTLLHSKSSREEEELNRENAIVKLRTMHLEERLNEKVKDLAFGHQRTVALTMVLSASPQIILLDEPTSGLSLGEATQIAEIIRQIRNQFNITTIIIEHNVGLIMGLCDRVMAMNFGKKIVEGAPDKVQRHPDVIEAYLGKQR